MSMGSQNPSVKELRRLAELRAAYESSVEAAKVAAQRASVLESALRERDERIGRLESQLVDDDGLEEACASLEARLGEAARERDAAAARSTGDEREAAYLAGQAEGARAVVKSINKSTGLHRPEILDKALQKTNKMAGVLGQDLLAGEARQRVESAADPP